MSARLVQLPDGRQAKIFVRNDSAMTTMGTLRPIEAIVRMITCKGDDSGEALRRVLAWITHPIAIYREAHDFPKDGDRP